MRFDEVELEAVPLMIEDEPPAPVLPSSPSRSSDEASWWRRALAMFTDLSVFAALALALSPLLPQPLTFLPTVSLGGFVLVFSYYYFVGSWILWGKTIGGAIFDVRVSESARTVRGASMRWLILILAVSVTGTAAALWILSPR